MSELMVLEVGREDEEERIGESVSDILRHFNVVEGARGGTVVLKPNLCTPSSYASGGTTDLRIIEALCARLSGACEVVLAEGVGRGYHAREVFDRLGIFEIGRRFGVKVVDLEEDERIVRKVPSPRRYPEFNLPRTIADAGYLINLPVLKTHNQTGVSLSVKNMFGCLSQSDRARCHFLGLHESLSDLNQAVKSDLVIVDGIHGMEGNGPTAGKPRKDNIMVASDDAVAADYYCAEMMGYEPQGIRHLRYAMDDSGFTRGEVKVLGRIGDLRFEKASVEAEYAYPLLGGMRKSFLQRYFYLTEFRINAEKCVKCGVCRKACPQGAISGEFVISGDLCRNCNICREFCPKGAVDVKGKFGFRNLWRRRR
jgi:uncharacterized protein (DUF362 family)/Pyruvate/2-oxoacid:ferredoxin oxidoreductase delta subunit